MLKKRPFELAPHSVLLSIVLLAFITKLVLGWWFSGSFFERGNSYHSLNALAFNLLNHQEYAIETGIASIDYEPLYPLTLAMSYWIFGANWFGVTLVQAILYGATSWLLFLMGSAIWNAKAGLFAGIYHSFYPFLFFHSLSVVDTTLYVFLAVATLYSVLNAAHGASWKYILIGVLIGLLFLSRGSAIALMPPIVLFLIYQIYFCGVEKPLVKSVLCLLAVGLVLSPWLIRNYQHTGKLVISAHGGFGIWQGNNPKSLLYLKNDLTLDRVYQDKPRPEIYVKYPMRPRPPEEAMNVAAEYRREAVNFIVQNPGTFIELAVWKFIKFWSVIYNPVGKGYAYGGPLSRQIVNFVAYLPLFLLFPIGLWNIWQQPGKRDIALLLAGLIAVYTAAHMVALGYTRLRLPLDPILMVLTGVAVSNFFGRQKKSAAVDDNV